MPVGVGGKPDTLQRRLRPFGAFTRRGDDTDHGGFDVLRGRQGGQEPVVLKHQPDLLGLSRAQSARLRGVTPRQVTVPASKPIRPAMA